jgi:hypothetical protein
MRLNVNDNPKKIYVNESKLCIIGENLEGEGVKFSPPTNNSPYIDTRIEPIKLDRKSSSNTDAANKVADTRFFGNKNNILYGDGTLGGKSYSLYDIIENLKVLIDVYNSAIQSVKNGKRYEPILTDCPQRTRDAIINNMLNQKLTDEQLIEYFSNRIYQFSKQYDMSISKYKRAKRMKDPDKLIPRYDVGVVPGTDVKVIALFKFRDFNFSDAIKNGELRQTKDTDSMLGITDFRKEREKNDKLYGKGNGTNKKLSTTYDNGTVTPDIATNFSLNGINVDTNDPSSLVHFKQQFKSRNAYNSEDAYNADSKQGYNSITQFMDKSILAANYALKNEGIKVDYIIPAPSSSKFNKYYCFNLSQKLGVPCNFNFFSRNLLNVQLDEGIYNAGLTDKIINDTKRIIKDAALTEVSSYLMKTVKDFVAENFDVLGNISVEPHSREKASFGLVCEFLKHYSYYGLVNIYKKNPKTSNLHMYLVNHFMDYTTIKKAKNINVEHILSQIMFVIRTKISKPYQEMLKKIDYDIWKYQDYFKGENGGWKLSYCKKFKITDIDKKARQFVKNAYVVSDSEMDEDGHLFERYKNAHFLIVDEDMNSGGTLMLLINALKDQLVGHVGRRGRYANIKSDQITCLVNGYTLV